MRSYGKSNSKIACSVISQVDSGPPKDRGRQGLPVKNKQKQSQVFDWLEAGRGPVRPQKRIQMHIFSFTLRIRGPGWLWRERVDPLDFSIPELIDLQAGVLALGEVLLLLQCRS